MEDSAILGQPPKSEADFFIIRGMLRTFGLVNKDPQKGIRLPYRRPPPGQYHFETRGPGIIAGVSVSIALMVAITGTRLALRYFRPRLIWGWDDWLIIPGVLLAITWPALMIPAVLYGGAGKHMYDLTYREYNVFKLLIAPLGPVLFLTAVGVIKMSITCFNMRITGLTSKRWMIAHRTFLAILVIYTIVAVCTIVFNCRPPRAGFDTMAAGKLAVPARCGSMKGLIELEMTHNVIHIIMDFCLLSVPIIVIWKVKMHWTTKLRLFFVFSIGAVSCIGSIMRTLVELHGLIDISYDISKLINWVLVELTFGVTAASLPVLSALIPSPIGSGGRLTGYAGFTSNLPHIPSNTTDPGGERAQGLQSKGSREGILREDAVELHFQTTGPLGERDQTSGTPVSANHDGLASPSPVKNYPMTTYPTATIPPKRSWRSHFMFRN